MSSYAGSRLEDICDLLRSVKGQSSSNYELVYVTEGNESLQEFVVSEAKVLDIPVKVVRNTGAPGLSESRNLGVDASRGEILGFVDDDVILDSQWVQNVERVFREHDSIVGVTGASFPRWIGKEADWWPHSLDWLISCTRWIKSKAMFEVTNCWGMNMAFRKSVIIKVGKFNTMSTETSRYLRLGSAAKSSGLSPSRSGEMAEDVDISLRVRQNSHKSLCFVPDIKVISKVYPYRLSNKFIIQRANFVGYSRRNVESRRPDLDRDVVHFEPFVALLILQDFFSPSELLWSNLTELGMRYRVLLLASVSLFLGYFLGPIQ